jgi:mRNA degradation ribonuclease J1/J2
VRAVAPRFVLPIHGQHWHLWRHRDLLAEAGLGPHQVLEAVSGQTLTVRPESGEVEVRTPEVRHEAVFVGSQSRWRSSEPALRARRKLARTGGATAVLPWSAGLAGRPQVITQGVFASLERRGVERALARELQAELEGRFSTADEAQIEEHARILLRRLVKRRTGTKVECRVRLWHMVENDKV